VPPVAESARARGPPQVSSLREPLAPAVLDGRLGAPEVLEVLKRTRALRPPPRGTAAQQAAVAEARPARTSERSPPARSPV
jgi:hypothetical protein